MAYKLGGLRFRKRVPLEGPQNKEDSMGSILGFPYLWKLPREHAQHDRR